MASFLQFSPILCHSSSTPSMASFLQSSPILSLPSSTPSHSSSSLACFHSKHFASRISYPRNTCPKRNLVRRCVTSEVPDPPQPPPQKPTKSELIAPLKNKLVDFVSGLAANEVLQKADEAAKVIEAAIKAVAGPVDLSVDPKKMQGRWKLIYSSARLPLTVCQVFQKIDISSKDLQNIVELKLPGDPRCEGTDMPSYFIPSTEPVEVTATLDHKFEFIGSSKVKITINHSKAWHSETKIPDALKPAAKTGSAEFEVTYLDADTRITRGDGGELWVWSLSP